MSEVEHRNEPQKKMETEACTGSTMEKMLGIQICGKAEFPVSSQTYGAPMYPFSGNAELSLVLKKTDASLTSYNFEAGWTNNQVRTVGKMPSASIFKITTKWFSPLILLVKTRINVPQIYGL